MWELLPSFEKNEYKRMILAFASLTEMFAQKAEDTDITPSPIINSKYQETVFQKTFHACAEDVGNTSYDASINSQIGPKFLVGIKTFGIDSGLQKIAQFKANLTEWSQLINLMNNNAIDADGRKRTKAEIDQINAPYYLELAKRISLLRNKRINSSEENLKGFSVKDSKVPIEAVYHVLMPSKKGITLPTISVGEIPYKRIDIDNIKVLGCTSVNTPANFNFTDGVHDYRFTSADSQLLMNFHNNDIVKELWNVKYAEDAYSIFSEIAKKVYDYQSDELASVAAYDEPQYTPLFREEPKCESYSWLITNRYNEVEQFSGFNSFYGVGSKLGTDTREDRINKIEENYNNLINSEILQFVLKGLKEFLLTGASSAEEKQTKIDLRDEIINKIALTDNPDFIEDVSKLLYRPYNEMYIPLPNSKEFHDNHPNFFGPNIGTFKKNSAKLALDKEDRRFNLVFEPSGDILPAYITQDNGKAIESADKQSYLGEWILRGIFQLAPYEPLTTKRLNEIGINGIRLSKFEGDDDIHLTFVWIDVNNPPKDFIYKF